MLIIRYFLIFINISLIFHKTPTRRAAKDLASHLNGVEHLVEPRGQSANARGASARDHPIKNKNYYLSLIYDIGIRTIRTANSPLCATENRLRLKVPPLPTK